PVEALTRSHRGVVRSGMRMRMVVVALLVISPPRADADNVFQNVLIGPVIGVRLGGREGPRGGFGVEGGVGIGPGRVNLGFEYRDDKLFGYVEFDPWYLVGGSFGLGVDSDGDLAPVLGAWEGFPLKIPDCDFSNRADAYGSAVTIAGGYRYTGVHELY